MVVEKLDFEPSGLAELVVTEHSRSRCSRSLCSLCRMAGGGLSNRLHLTSCRMQAEQGLFSSHCHGVSSSVSARSESCAGEKDSRYIVEEEGEPSVESREAKWTKHQPRREQRGGSSQITHLDTSLPASHTPIPRLCIPKSRHGGGGCSSRC